MHTHHTCKYLHYVYYSCIILFIDTEFIYKIYKIYIIYNIYVLMIFFVLYYMYIFTYHTCIYLHYLCVWKEMYDMCSF